MRVVRLLLLFSLAFSALPAAEITLDQGTLPSGAAYSALKPRTWDQRRLLLIAPAQRAESQPATATLDLASPLIRGFLADRWLVATLAYRRAGIVIKDSVEDLNALRAQLAARHGQPDRVYVLGESLGGGIAVRLMENFPDDYAGAVAVGGSFDLQEPAPTLGVSFAPQRPLLLLPNQSESHAPETYVRVTASTPIPAVLWKIGRDGRANTNAAEKRAALDAVVRWVEGGTPPAPNFDATLPPPARASTVSFSSDRSAATGVVVAIDPVRGDVTLDFQPADLDVLGIARGSLFAATYTDHTGAARTLRLLYGFNVRTAKAGDWMALPEAEGGLLVSVYRGHASALSGLTVGDRVTLRRLREK